MPFFSVIVPVYNAGQWVGRAIESVLAQTFDDFELILVDDGSPDDSAEVIARYTDPRVKLIRQENRGVSGARNRGIEVSSGMWITFLDADDEWLPEFLEARYRVIGDYPEIDFCYSSYCNNYQDGRSVPAMNLAGVTAPILSRDCFSDGLFVRFIPWIGTVAVRHSLLEETGLFPVGMKIGEDIHLMMRILLKARQIAFIPREETLYYCDIGVMAQNAKEKVKQRSLSHYPATLLSIEQWEAEGKIPPERYPSVRRFVLRWFIPWFIYQKGFDRAYGVARTMLRRHVSFARHPICYARALVSFGFGWLRSFPALRAVGRLVTGKRKRADS